MPSLTKTQQQLLALAQNFGVLNIKIAAGVFIGVMFRGIFLFSLCFLGDCSLPIWYFKYAVVHIFGVVLFGSYLKHSRRLRDLFLLNAIALAVSVDLIGFPLIYFLARYHVWWLAGLIAGLIGWKLSRLKHYARFWDQVRQRHLLRRFIDEQQWRIRYRLFEFERSLAKERGQNEKGRRWIARAEKFSPLVPGIAIFLRRTLGHTAEMIAILGLTLGMILLWEALEAVVAYLKIREWDKRRGQALVMEI